MCGIRYCINVTRSLNWLMIKADLRVSGREFKSLKVLGKNGFVNTLGQKKKKNGFSSQRF